MQISAVVLTTLMALNGPAADPAPRAVGNSAPRTEVISDCFVELIDEAKVSPQEAGILSKIHLHEGDQVYGVGVSESVTDYLQQRSYGVKMPAEPFLRKLREVLLTAGADPQTVTRAIDGILDKYGTQEGISGNDILDMVARSLQSNRGHGVAVSEFVEDYLQQQSYAVKLPVEPMLGDLGKVLSAAKVDPTDVPRAIQDLLDKYGARGRASSRDILETMERSLNIILGEIDVDRAKMQEDAAEDKLAVAHAKAVNTTSIEYATAAMRVARIEWQRNQIANNETPRTITAMEMERLLLTYHRSLWEIKQAEVDLKIAGLEEEVAQTEWRAAVDSVERHIIRSPLNGEIIDVKHHEGEWVQPNNSNGDPVFHIVRLDTLWVSGRADSGRIPRGKILERRVDIHIKELPAQLQPLSGIVQFASPEIQSGQYRVLVRIENRKDSDGHWLLLPGMRGTITVTLK